MKGYIYLIESIVNNKRYLGSTNNPSIRIKEHNDGVCKSTKYNSPWKCLVIIYIGNLVVARRAEYYIKRQKEKLTIQNVVKNLNQFFNKTSALDD